MNISNKISGAVLLLMCGAQFYCNHPTNPIRTPLEGLYGRVVGSHGHSVPDAKIMVIQIADSLGKTIDSIGSGGILYDSTVTDTSGIYVFAALAAGTYTIIGEYEDGKMLVCIPAFSYDGAGTAKEVPTDTMRLAGYIHGSVNTPTDSNAGVICSIAGTSFSSISNDSGRFVFAAVPQGTYDLIARRAGLVTIRAAGIRLEAGKGTMVSQINFKGDPAFPPPSPFGLSVKYDTVQGCAILRWHPVRVSDLQGYVIYRNVAVADTPRQLFFTPITDTIYIDSVFTNPRDTSTVALEYRLKSQDSDGNMSTSFSKPFTMSAPSPSTVRTLIRLTNLNPTGDTISINDTLTIIAAYSNKTRKSVELRWFEDSKQTGVRVVYDTLFTGSDTMRFAWPQPALKRIYVGIRDERNTVWWDSISIRIIRDVPVVNAGADTIVAINSAVAFNGSASRRLGTIAAYLWDFDGDGNFDDSSTVGGGMIHTYTHAGVYTAKLFVRADDGNTNTATRKVTVANQTPIVQSLRPDTTVSVNDSVLLFASVYDPDGHIAEYSWDFTGDGFFEYNSQTTISIGFRYSSSPGIYSAILRVKDDDGKYRKDTVRIKVVLDIPAAHAGYDTSVSVNSAIPFHGTATQLFGTIVMYKWDFDGDGVYDDSSASSGEMLHTYTHADSYTAKLSVRDDDGNTSAASRIVTVINHPPLVKSLRPDTTISVNDSVPFNGSAVDLDGTVTEYAWDFTGDGAFEFVSAIGMETGFRYGGVGEYNAVLRIVDDDARFRKDTVKISVVEDIPVAHAGADTTVFVNTPVPFHGFATQKFGMIVFYRWDFTNDGAYDDSSTGSGDAVYAYTQPGIYSAKLYVRDDDGNAAIDKRTITVIKRPLGLSTIQDDLQVNQVTGKNQDHAMVTFSKSGNCLVTWNDFSPASGAVIKARIYDKAGMPVINEFQVNNSLVGDQHAPSCANDNLGHFVIVWSGGTDTSGYSVFAKVFSTTGEVVTDQFTVSTKPSVRKSWPDVAMAPNGNFTVIWDCVDNGAYDILLRMFGLTSVAQTNEIRVNESVMTIPSTTEGFGLPDIDVNSNGDLAISWEKHDILQWKIMYRFMNLSSGTTGTEQALDDPAYVSIIQRRPSTSINSAGDALFTWTNYNDYSQSSGDIACKLFSKSTTGFSPTLCPHPDTTGNQTRSIGILADDNRCFVGWTDYFGSASYDVAMRIFDGNLQPVSDTIVVNSRRAMTQQRPSLGLLKEGNAFYLFCSWESSNKDGDGWGVFAKEYLYEPQ
jgi:PKD repeat protein